MPRRTKVSIKTRVPMVDKGALTIQEARHILWAAMDGKRQAGTWQMPHIDSAIEKLVDAMHLAGEDPRSTSHALLHCASRLIIEGLKTTGASDPC